MEKRLLKEAVFLLVTSTCFGVFLMAAAAAVPLCATHPHFRRRHTSRGRSSSHPFSETLDDQTLELSIKKSHFQLVSHDVDSLLHDLACKLDRSCSPMMLDILPGGNKQYNNLSGLSHSEFLTEMFRGLKEFCSKFEHIVDQISRLRSNLVLDSNDALYIHGNMLVNDMKELIALVQKATHIHANLQSFPTNGPQLDESALLTTFIPELKDFKNFIEKCKNEFHSRKRMS